MKIVSYLNTKLNRAGKQELKKKKTDYQNKSPMSNDRSMVNVF